MPRFSGGFDKVYKGQKNISDEFVPKNNYFPQNCDHIPSISEHFPRNHVDPPKYVDLRAFY